MGAELHCIVTPATPERAGNPCACDLEAITGESPELSNTWSMVSPSAELWQVWPIWAECVLGGIVPKASASGPESYNIGQNLTEFNMAGLGG